MGHLLMLSKLLEKLGNFKRETYQGVDVHMEQANRIIIFNTTNSKTHC